MQSFTRLTDSPVIGNDDESSQAADIHRYSIEITVALITRLQKYVFSNPCSLLPKMNAEAKKAS
jgi:hypothetical protein